MLDKPQPLVILESLDNWRQAMHPNETIMPALAAITKGTALEGMYDASHPTQPHDPVIDVWEFLCDEEVVVSGDPRGDDYITECPDEATLIEAVGKLIENHADELSEIVTQMHMAENYPLGYEHEMRSRRCGHSDTDH